MPFIAFSRVHTLKLGITSELSELYKSADAASLSAILIKLGVERSQTTRLDDCRRAVESKVVSSLREYRSMHSSHFRGINKLIYPDSLKYLPVWVLGILKSTALRCDSSELQRLERKNDIVHLVQMYL